MSHVPCHISKKKTKYEALSYTWVDELATQPIYIDEKLALVGPNLREAIEFLRDKHNERVLWIDAICINQADVQEKNKQLSIMPYIYTRAQTVVVWLGCHDFGDLIFSTSNTLATE
jgi:Heterokaryon incompatibility protein (HET)